MDKIVTNIKNFKNDLFKQRATKEEKHFLHNMWDMTPRKEILMLKLIDRLQRDDPTELGNQFIYGSTPLQAALIHSQERIALRLIESGYANIGLPERGAGQYTALMWAIDGKLSNLALTIIETGQSNPGHKSREGNTALMMACTKKLNEVALRLIETGQSDPGNINEIGMTALIIACMKGLKEVALRLIETGQSNPGQANIYGNTALMFACGRTDIQDVAIKLLETGEANLEQVNNKGYTAFDYANLNGLKRIVHHESNKKVQEDMLNFKKARDRGSLQTLPEDMNVTIASYLVPKDKNTIELYKGGKKTKTKRKTKRKRKSKTKRKSI